MRFKLLTGLVPIWLLFSCDCVYQSEGILVDKESGVSLSDVQITVGEGEMQDTLRSDSEGHFKYEAISGFCEFKEFAFSGDRIKAKKLRIYDGHTDTLYLELLPEPILQEIKVDRFFSSQRTKDHFQLILRGENLREAQVEFSILNAENELLWQEEFRGWDFIGYALLDASKAEEEAYIQKRITEFFSDKNFEFPAIAQNDSSSFDEDYAVQDEWESIARDSTATGFKYLIGEERIMAIAYSKDLKKVVVYFSCC